MGLRAGSTAHGGSPLVVAAKLLVPAPRPETVVRERVVALLDEASERPLTVVSAAAGYGKTTAVTTWLATVDWGRAWVSLDALDSDPQRLLAHVIAAIEGAVPGATADAGRALNAGGSNLLESVVPLIVDALAERVDERLVVVLDDYHAVESQDCHQLVEGLIDALPPSVGMIVCSRALPPLRIARRRALGTVGTLGARELAFQAGESERLLNGSLGLALDSAAVAAVESRVEGWAAGLALAASSLAEQDDRARFLSTLSSRSGVIGTEVAEYLVEEVLDRTQPRIREFLCRTSILSRLNGPLCAAVLEDEAAHDLLAEVRRSNLFVTVVEDDRGEWLRYHQLFAELLERDLHVRSPAVVPLLHRRAADWFAANDLPEQAIAHATAAGDGERAAGLLYDTWTELMRQWRFVTIRRLIAQMPSNRGELAGFCEALDTVCWALEGADLRLVAQRLDALESLRDAPGVAPIIDRSRVSPFYGDIARAVKDGWAAWERYPALRFRTELSGQFGQVLWFAGDSAAARDIIEPHLYEIERPAARSWALGTLALIAADDGDIALAERYGRQAVEATSLPTGHGVRESHFGHTALAEALRLRGALDEAEDQLAHAAHLTGKHPSSFFHVFTLVFQAQLALTQRDRARAREHAHAARAIIDRYPDPGTLANRLETVESTVERRRDEELLGSRPSDAEMRVLELLATDLTFEQIAKQLYLSPNTVGAHRRRLYRRLGARSREHAIAIARERGLL
jgi:LuxR family maltose regulon positive regulatory protein